jgi:hypothetical protein
VIGLRPRSGVVVRPLSSTVRWRWDRRLPLGETMSGGLLVMVLVATIVALALFLFG